MGNRPSPSGKGRLGVGNLIGGVGDVAFKQHKEICNGRSVKKPRRENPLIRFYVRSSSILEEKRGKKIVCKRSKSKDTYTFVTR